MNFFYRILSHIILVGFIAAVSFISIAQEYESYLSRPDVLTLKSQKHETGLMKGWEELKRAHIETTVMLFEMYPEHEIYFLARDSELLYDSAKVMFKDNPELLKKIHLLNISRTNMRAPNVIDYLAQEGISTKNLSQGKKILFVDTGFSGSIPNTLRDYFPIEYHKNIQTHLLSSATNKYPSTRVFLASLNREAANLDPGKMHGTISNYEQMPRYTDRSTKFELRDGKWQAISVVGGNSDGNVSKELAIKYAEDLKNYLEKDSSKNLMISRKKLWREVLDLTKNQDRQLLISKLKAIAENEKLGVYGEALVRDLLEASHKNGVSNLGDIKLADINLHEVGQNSVVTSNKIELTKKYPEWKKFLLTPEIGISQLLADKDIATLGKIVDVVNDYQFGQVLARKLGEHDTKESRTIIKTLIEKASPGNSSALNLVITEIFTQKQTKEMKDLYKLAILKAVETKNLNQLTLIASNLFSLPHTVDMPELYKLLIEKAFELKDKNTLNAFVIYVMDKPHTSRMKELYQFLIQKALELNEPAILKNMIIFSFSKPHTKEMVDLYRLVIESAAKANNPELLKLFARLVFSQPHTAGMKDLYQLVIQKSIELKNHQVLAEFVGNVFPKAHSKEMSDLYKIVIQKLAEYNDKWTLKLFAQNVLKEPHTKNMLDVYELLIKKSIELKMVEPLAALKVTGATTPHMQTPEFNSVMKVLDGIDNEPNWDKLGNLVKAKNLCLSRVLQQVGY